MVSHSLVVWDIWVSEWKSDREREREIRKKRKFTHVYSIIFSSLDHKQHPLTDIMNTRVEVHNGEMTMLDFEGNNFWNEMTDDRHQMKLYSSAYLFVLLSCLWKCPHWCVLGLVRPYREHKLWVSCNFYLTGKLSFSQAWLTWAANSLFGLCWTKFLCPFIQWNINIIKIFFNLLLCTVTYGDPSNVSLHKCEVHQKFPPSRLTDIQCFTVISPPEGANPLHACVQLQKPYSAYPEGQSMTQAIKKIIYKFRCKTF